MVTLICEETLRQELSDYYTKIDEEFLQRLKSLCMIYDESEDSMVSQWMAFAMKRNITETSLDLVNEFESDRLMKKAIKEQKMSEESKKMINLKSQNNHSSEKLEFIDEYIESFEKNKNTTTIEVAMDDDEVIKDHNESKNDRTPLKKIKMNDHSIDAVSVMTTPSVMIKAEESFETMNTSQNAIGSDLSIDSNVLCYFGNSQSNDEWKSADIKKHMTCDFYDKTLSITLPIKFMSLKTSECNAVMNESIDQLSEMIQNKLDIDSFGTFGTESAAEKYYIGRVKCDSSKGKIDEQSALIEGSSFITNSQSIRLDLSQLSAYSLFPGQILTCKATNDNGKSLIVREIIDYENIVNEFSKITPSLTKPLHLVVAVGPFTIKQSLHYQSLRDILKYAKDYTPDYLILMGPFVDANNEQLNNIEESIDCYFHSQMKLISEELMHVKTEAIVIPSSRDLNHFNIFPSSPFSGYLSSKIHFYPNPCVITINGVVIALTSTDVIMHLSKEEFGINQQSDRLGRLCRHIIMQRNFYPLFPPNPEVNLEFTKYESLKLPVTPHLMILPSDLKHFVKNICKSIVLNPGRISKNTIGRIKIDPFAEGAYNGSLEPYINAEIVKMSHLIQSEK